jgi:hypothetical protein
MGPSVYDDGRTRDRLSRSDPRPGGQTQGSQGESTGTIGQRLQSRGEMEATAFEEQPQQEKTRLDPLRYHKHYQQGNSPYAGGSSFMERVAEAVARGMGRWCSSSSSRRC